jgi:hypothetical protein
LDDSYGTVAMTRLSCILIVISSLLPWPAVAQFVPEPPGLNPIPVPQAPPPEPPIINGPWGQGPAPGVAPQKHLNTFQDRTARCQEQAADAGLRGKRRSAYTRRCVNAQ